VKPASVTTPTIKSTFTLEQESLINPLFPTLDQIQILLSKHYFVQFNGESELFFQSQNNVADTLTHLWQKFPNLQYLKLQHPSYEGEESVVYHVASFSLSARCHLEEILRQFS
jgi:hypothetical protein